MGPGSPHLVRNGIEFHIPQRSLCDVHHRWWKRIKTLDQASQQARRTPSLCPIASEETRQISRTAPEILDVRKGYEIADFSHDALAWPWLDEAPRSVQHEIKAATRIPVQ